MIYIAKSIHFRALYLGDNPALTAVDSDLLMRKFRRFLLHFSFTTGFTCVFKIFKEPSNVGRVECVKDMILPPDSHLFCSFIEILRNHMTILGGSVFKLLSMLIDCPAEVDDYC